MASGIIFDIKKFAIHDGPGIRTTVFFKGCPLSCRWCHNPESRKEGIETLCVKARRDADAKGTREEVFGRTVSVSEIMAEIQKDRIFYEESGGGATFSGGEPLLQLAFLTELLRECKKCGIQTAVDTSGFVPYDSFECIIELTDIILYDLKLIDKASHLAYVGVDNNLILENFKRLVACHSLVIPRIPLIPGISDSDDNLNDVLSLLASIKGIQKVSLLPYNKLVEDKLERFHLINEIGHLRTQEKDHLEQLRFKFAEQGYDVSIGG